MFEQQSPGNFLKQCVSMTTFSVTTYLSGGING